jgi:hypothetical protein
MDMLAGGLVTEHQSLSQSAAPHNRLCVSFRPATLATERPLWLTRAGLAPILPCYQCVTTRCRILWRDLCFLFSKISLIFPSQSKENQGKIVGFAWFYSSDSGLFNGLRRFQIKNPLPLLSSSPLSRGAPFETGH